MKIKKKLALLWYIILLAAQVYTIFFFDGFMTYGEKAAVRYPILIFFAFYVLLGLILFVIPLFKRIAFNYSWLVIGLVGLLILSYPFTNQYFKGIRFDGYHLKRTNYYFDDGQYQHQADTDVFLRYYTSGKTVYMAEGYFTNMYNTLYSYEVYDCEVIIDPDFKSELSEDQAEAVYENPDFYSFQTAPIGTDNVHTVSCYFGEDFASYDTYYVYYTENDGMDENIFIMPLTIYNEVVNKHE